MKNPQVRGSFHEQQQFFFLHFLCCLTLSSSFEAICLPDYCLYNQTSKIKIVAGTREEAFYFVVKDYYTGKHSLCYTDGMALSLWRSTVFPQVSHQHLGLNSTTHFTPTLEPDAEQFSPKSARKGLCVHRPRTRASNNPS